jgi:hypothetical protein
MKSFAILLLLGEIDAHKCVDNDMVQLDIQQSMENGLGSLEGAYLAQKQLMKEKAFKWDESVLGVVDQKSYVASQKDALEEQEVNIEFVQKNPIKEEAWSEAPAAQPVQSLAEKHNVAHKEKKIEVDDTVIPGADKVERSNIAQIATKFEEESREFDAQDKALYIEGLNGKMRLRHASDGFADAEKQKKYEEENSAKILAQLKKEKEETQKKLAALAEKKKNDEKKKKDAKINKQIDEMRKEWTIFSETLDTTHADKAREIWNSLAEQGRPQEPLKVMTK